MSPPSANDSSGPDHQSEDSAPGERRMPPVVPFATLAQGREEVWIQLDERIYRLRRTRQGKLILTK